MLKATDDKACFDAPADADRRDRIDRAPAILTRELVSRAQRRGERLRIGDEPGHVREACFGRSTRDSREICDVSVGEGLR